MKPGWRTPFHLRIPCLHVSIQPSTPTPVLRGVKFQTLLFRRDNRSFSNILLGREWECGQDRHSCSKSNTNPSRNVTVHGGHREGASVVVGVAGWEVPPEVYLKYLMHLILFSKPPLTSSRAEFCFRTLVFISASSTDRVTFRQFSWVRTPGRGPCLPIPVLPPNPYPR